MVILGGMGSTVGVCLAAVLLTILPEWLRIVDDYPWLPEWLRPITENRMILYSLLLIILDAHAPAGTLRRGELQAKDGMSCALAATRRVTMQFGGLRCISDFSFSVDDGNSSASSARTAPAKRPSSI